MAQDNSSPDRRRCSVLWRGGGSPSCMRLASSSARHWSQRINLSRLAQCAEHMSDRRHNFTTQQTATGSVEKKSLQHSAPLLALERITWPRFAFSSVAFQLVNHLLLTPQAAATYALTRAMQINPLRDRPSRDRLKCSAPSASENAGTGGTRSGLARQVPGRRSRGCLYLCVGHYLCYNRTPAPGKQPSWTCARTALAGRSHTRLTTEPKRKVHRQVHAGTAPMPGTRAR